MLEIDRLALIRESAAVGGLNVPQLDLMYEIANQLPPFSEDISELDLFRHTLIGALIDFDGTPKEIPENARQANITQGRFRLLIDVDTCETITDDHFARIEYFAKEAMREAGWSEDQITDYLSTGCDCGDDS